MLGSEARGEIFLPKFSFCAGLFFRDGGGGGGGKEKSRSRKGGRLLMMVGWFGVDVERWWWWRCVEEEAWGWTVSCGYFVLRAVGCWAVCNAVGAMDGTRSEC